MQPHLVVDRAELATHFGHDPQLHVYELGDLEDLFWPRTDWYRLEPGGPVALLYRAPGLPTLVCMGREDSRGARERLLTALQPLLPDRVEVHLGVGGVEPLLATGWSQLRAVPHLRLALATGELVEPGSDVDPEELTAGDLPPLLELYARAYPGNWFDPGMLATGQYLGAWAPGRGRLLAVAGVHVYSESQRIAALGNVATDPDARGQGLATALVAALCRRLSATVDHVGLNVRADNTAAIRLYQRLGFRRVAEFTEGEFVRSPSPPGPR